MTAPSPTSERPSIPDAKAGRFWPAFLLTLTPLVVLGALTLPGDVRKNNASSYGLVAAILVLVAYFIAHSAGIRRRPRTARGILVGLAAGLAFLTVTFGINTLEWMRGG